MVGVFLIVYGVFGLGFFVYLVGGSIDVLFFSDLLFVLIMGMLGVFWVVFIMVILMLLVVIVVIEEGLCCVFEGLKVGSYVLGVIKIEIIMKIILFIVLSGIMIGVILVIVRVVGEVVFFMLVGVVKFVFNLFFDGEFLYFYFDC